MTEPLSTVSLPAHSRRTLAVGDYDIAQRVVDHLSDRGFPVEHTVIVGTGLRLVEAVTGRLSWGRVLLSGAGSGAWVGLFIGVLFGLFTVTTYGFVVVVVSALVLGALFGLAFAAAGYAATRGRRDFTSLRGLQADRYEVLVDAERYDEALRLAQGLPGVG